MPCYNEADNIEGAIADIHSHVFAVVAESELLVIDDGSRDDTAARARRHAIAERRVRVITQANAGHGPALVRGLREARGDWCLLLDSDRQIGLEQFAQTWTLAQGHDAVLGVRQDRDDPRHRLVLTRALRLGLAWIFDVRAADANVPYKLVRRTHALAALASMPPQPLVPSILLTMYLRHSDARVLEQPVRHFARAAGETTLRPWRLVRFCRRAVAEVLRFQRTLRRQP